MSVVIGPNFVHQYALSNSVLAGAKLFTYAANTTNKQATWTDATQTVQSPNPIILDANGIAVYWVDPTLTYKYVLALPSSPDPPTSPLFTVDGVSGAAAALYPQTLAESNAGVTPNLQFLGFPEQAIIGRYGATGGGLANAVSVATQQGVIGTNYTLFIDQTISLTANLTIPNTMNIQFIGGGAINIASGKVLTLNGTMEGPFTQATHITGSGTFTITPVGVGTGSVQFSNKLQLYGAAFTPTNAIGTSGTAFTLDASKGNVASVTLNTNVTAGNLTFSNFSDGQTVNLYVMQDT